MVTLGLKSTDIAKCNVYIYKIQGVVYPETPSIVPTWVMFSG